MFKIFSIICLIIFLYFYTKRYENFGKIYDSKTNDIFLQNIDYKIKYYKQTDNNFFLKIQKKLSPPLIYNRDKFKKININNKLIKDYDKIRIFILNKINSENLQKDKFEEIDNKLYSITKNNYCNKFSFDIVLKKTLVYLQLECVVIKDYLNIYFDKIYLKGSSLYFNKEIKPLDEKHIFNNFEPLIPNENLLTKKKYENNTIIKKNTNNILNNIKKKHSLEEYNGAYNYSCRDKYNLDSGPNSNKFFCELSNKLIKKEPETDKFFYWDKPCKKNNDCPFYKKNKNYKNNRGGCIKGYCEMPLNVKRIRYKLYDKNTKPFCYNCNNILQGDCCEDQKNRKLYPNLKSPDYAFSKYIDYY